MSDLLTLSGVTKSYGGVAALAGVDVSARAGEIHALLGENGAGKSTCIKTLAGAIAPDDGHVEYAGERVTFGSPLDAADAGIAAVFQELSLVPDLTVAQNVFFGREDRTFLRTIDGRALNLRTSRLFESLDIVGISPQARARDLSVGERQVVEIAKAVSREPRVLILDEATSALSSAQTEWLLKLARKLADLGTLVIFISHRMQEVRELADRMTILRNGQSVGTYDVDELTDDEIVTKMLGRRAGNLYPEFDVPVVERVLLEARRLTDGHRLRGVDLALHAGEILGVGGLQGQGQVELFESLAGLRRADGTIAVDGKDVRFRSVRDAHNAGIGVALVPEDRKTQGLLLEKPVRENLMLSTLRQVARFGLVSRSREDAAVAADIARLSIALSSPEQAAGSLSGGNQQKIVIAKFRRTNAKVLLLFDLTRGVDVGTKADIFALMHELASKGYALLFFSTDNEELVNVCHRVAVMSYGRIAGVLEKDRLTDEAILGKSLLNNGGKS